MGWRGPQYEGEFPSLGPAVVDWIEAFLCHGPGDVIGQPVELDDELYAFVVRAYRLDPSTGQRVYRRAFLSRAKGRSKSELAGMLACAELLGPVRFAGWDAAGEPVGQPVTDPFVRCLATEEGQSGNTFANVAVMLDHLKSTHGTAFPVIDLGRSSQTSTRILVSGGGQVVPSTASGAAKDGGKETFSIFDEALSVDTPLPTPTGWTTMGEVQLGDELIGSQGQPVPVCKTTPVQTDRLCYRVSFSDGTSLVTSEGHQWWSKIRSSAAAPCVRTTGAIAADARTFRIPRGQAVKTPDVPAPIDPYVLGYWLGNGDARNGTVSVGTQDVNWIAQRLRGCGYTVTHCTVRNKAPLLYLRGLVQQLRQQGMLRNKHIPSLYLRASIDQRLELLRGLMDSDGYAASAGRGTCTFVQSDRDLVDSVRELLRSLAQVVSGRFDANARSRYGGTFRLWFTPHAIQPFALPRKANRVAQVAGRGPEWVTITDIAPVPSVPVRCVAVGAADHLFVAGSGWKVTHNTHLYTKPDLHRMHATVRRNLRKRLAAEPWGLETSTMYAPGEDSVAEATHAYAQSISEGKAREVGLLFDHRQAPAETDLANRKSLLAGLKAAYGPFSQHMDLDGIVAEIWDPQSDPNESRRYWLNQPTAATDAWLRPDQVDAVATAEEVVADGEPVALGFDGSRRREHHVTDSTALVGCRIRDGHLFLLPYGDGLSCWEQPDGPAGADWEVPTVQVDEAVAQAFERFQVVGFFADPARWESHLDGWTATYGPKLLTRASRKQPIQWWMTGGRSNFVVEATSRLHTAIVAGECSLDAGSGPLLRHLVNARRRVSASGVQIAKEHPTSPRKVDAAVAAILAWRARGDAVSAGYTTRRGSKRAHGF